MFGPLAMTTMVYLVIDPATEWLEVRQRRAPAALVIDPSGEAHFLWPSGGVRSAPPRPRPTSRFLPTGATVLIYTDGLVEAAPRRVDRSRPGAAARDRQGRARPQVPVRDHLRVPEEPEDDVAFIATGVPPLGDHVSTTWRVTPDSLAPIRYLLRRWLMNRGASEQRATTSSSPPRRARTPLQGAAYGPGLAEFEVDLRWEDGRVTITVTDATATWRRPRGEDRGLPLMRTLMDEVDVHHTDAGHVGEADHHPGVTVLANITGDCADVAIGHVVGEIDASNVVWVEEQDPRHAADQPAGRRPHRHHLLDSAGIAMLFRLAAEYANTSSSSGSCWPRARRSPAWPR